MRHLMLKKKSGNIILVNSGPVSTAWETQYQV